MYVMHAVAEGAYFDCHFLLHNMLAQQHNRPQVRSAADAKDCFVLIWGLASVTLQRATSAACNPSDDQDSSNTCQQNQQTF